MQLTILNKGRVVVICDTGRVLSSSWSVSDTFTTGCYAPDSNWSDPVTASGARLNWHKSSGALGYEIKGRRIGVAAWTSIVVGGGNTISKDVFGLNSGLSYEWTIRSICNNQSTLYSPFTSLDTFTTLNTSRWSSNELKAEEENLTIYPNPFSNQVFIEYTNPRTEHYSIRILDAKGVVVFERHEITDTKTIFNRKGLSAGVYFVEIIDDGVLRRKLLVQ